MDKRKKRLEKVLLAAELKADEQKQRVLMATEQHQASLTQAEQLRSYFAEFVQPDAQSVPANFFQNKQVIVDYVRTAQIELAQEVHQYQLKLDGEQNKWRDLYADQQGCEKLVERRTACLAQQEKRVEANLLDELAQQQHLRKKKS